jgi:hypothetical protein
MARSPKEKPRAFARGLPGWLRWDFSAAPPAAFSNLRLKTQKATAPTRGRLKAMCPANFAGGAGLFVLSLF